MQFAVTVVFPVPGGPCIANTVFFCVFINSAIYLLIFFVSFFINLFNLIILLFDSLSKNFFKESGIVFGLLIHSPACCLRFSLSEKLGSSGYLIKEQFFGKTLSLTDSETKKEKIQGSLINLEKYKIEGQVQNF